MALVSVMVMIFDVGEFCDLDVDDFGDLGFGDFDADDVDDSDVGDFDDGDFR